MGPAEPGDPTPTTWAAWEQHLVDAVLALPDGGSVTVAAPPGHARLARPSTRSRLRWLVGGRRRPISPAARLVRVEDHLRGHWPGADRLGGPFPWSREEVEAIQALGWHAPTVTDGEDFVRFWPDDVAQGPYLPEADARRAAAALAESFRMVLDLSPEGGPPHVGWPALQISS
ncbi:hypothetical protein [Nostocoides sp. Soil756]|uniref:TY-Chap domain-containing protein n=1 Tax=Nostocoides sp. Soil756 TaxID=1736399 RepID=UPI0006FA9052|nr:hypothetical protein [Tetrasphaera sp. Soil756]KRE62341.1 hypothetical protein ASG78_04665 [Tetrasphaera sp. Soil756]